MDKDQLPLKILESTKTTLGIKAVVSLINTAEGQGLDLGGEGWTVIVLRFGRFVFRMG